MSTPSVHESGIQALPCAFSAGTPPEPQPLMHNTVGAKDVLHHAAEAYIDTERLDQVERLVEGVGSKAAHYVPQAVTSVVSNYWFGTGRSSPTALPVGTTNWTEHEKGQTSGVNIDQSTSTPTPIDMDSESDDPDFMVPATSGPSGSELAADVSQGQPNGKVSLPDEVITSPPETAVVPEDEPEGEAIEVPNVAIIPLSESAHAGFAQPPEPTPPVTFEDEAQPVVNPSSEHAPMADPEPESVPPPPTQDDQEVEVAEAAHVADPPSEPPVVESAQLPGPPSPITSQDGAQADPPERVPMPDSEFEFVSYPSPQYAGGDAAESVHVLATVPESAHELLPSVPSQVPDPAVFHEEATHIGVTPSLEHTQIPIFITEEDESAVGATPGIPDSVPSHPASPHEEHTDTSCTQNAHENAHDVDHDAALSLREHASEDDVGSTLGAGVPAVQHVKGRENDEVPIVTDSGHSLPASAPTTPSKVTNGSIDKPYHPAELHPLNASYSPTLAKTAAATPPSLGSSSPSPSVREKGTHGHFHKRTASTVSQGSGSVHGRKKVGFFDKVRGEAKVIIGKIEHKKEMVEAGKRILHGEV